MRALPLLLVATALGACSVPGGDQSGPEQAYYHLLNVRAAGDLGALWELLHPDVRAELEGWYNAEKLAAYDIRTAYPESDKAAALAALADGARADLPDAQALFAKVLTAPAADALSGTAALSARVRAVASDDAAGRASVTTWGGDDLTFLRGPDQRWYWGLTPVEHERLKVAHRQASDNLKRVRANLKKLARNP